MKVHFNVELVMVSVWNFRMSQIVGLHCDNRGKYAKVLTLMLGYTIVPFQSFWRSQRRLEIRDGLPVRSFIL